MKRIAVFLLMILSYGNIEAQEVSYWVGVSSHPDPIMRHHEAFMDAFVKYINRPKKFIVDSTDGVAKIGNKSLNQDSNNETCRIETVSSVTHEGRETITISIGSGICVSYKCLTESSSKDNATLTTTRLIIEHQEESNRTATKSSHEYLKESLTEKGTSTNTSQFSYKCISICKYE